MTQEERLRLASILGQLDHVASYGEIIHAAATKFRKSEDNEYTCGLYQGRISAVNDLMPTIVRARTNLEEIVKGGYNV